MKMIDLKLPKNTKAGLSTDVPAKAEEDRWPYGMQLRFESEQCDKLPKLKEMKLGAKVDITGIGEVTSVRMNEEKGGKERYSVEIQLQQVGVEGKGKEKSESMSDAMSRHKDAMKMGK